MRVIWRKIYDQESDAEEAAWTAHDLNAMHLHSSAKDKADDAPAWTRWSRKS